MDINYEITKEALRRGYSNRTIRSYVYCAKRFFKFSSKDISKISKKDVREFLNKLAERKKTGNTINVYINALKFLFEEILGKRMKLNIKYSKIPKRLPVILTKEEVKRLFSVINNKKHRLMIELMYSTGLRVSELINLKVEDLNLDKSYGWIRYGKGNKDRLFIIAKRLKDKIKFLIKKEKLSTNNYLFNSNRKTKYSIRTPQQIIKKAIKKAKIQKRISCHSLRHSFTTHLIENGYEVTSVQSLLNHKSLDTTMIYVHIAGNLINVKSPFDNL